MIVELIGCTGCGKTTLSRQLQQTGTILDSNAFVLQWAGLAWLRPIILRTLALNLLAATACIVYWRENGPLLRFAANAVGRLPRSVSMADRLHILRLAVRNAGAGAVLRHHAPADKTIVVDEGIVHIAHSLFVHVDPAPDLAQTAAFARLVPLPDLIVYLRRPRTLLIQRTQARGHKRISPRDPFAVVSFIQHAEQMFEYLANDAQLRGRLIVADSLPIQAPRSRPSGAVIAFVGPEATGKSTLVAATTDWLRETAPTHSIHAGKPPPTAVTAPVAQILPLLRRRAGDLRTTRLEHAAASRLNEAPPAAGWKSLVYASRAVLLAWERRCLLLRAGNAAMQGQFVVCDRYPSELPGAMDSPRLLPQTVPAGIAGYPYRWLAALEKSLYAQIPPPDVVVRLYVSLETAKQRNKDRSKDDKQGDAYIAARHAQCRQWRRHGTRHIIDIDTEQPLDVTIGSVRQAIARALT